MEQSVSLSLLAENWVESDQQSGTRSADHALKKGTSLLCRKGDISILG
jgi:hypothetical protein